ncbi:hypothetical protein D3C73_1443270 [compost metagenome]
MVDQQASAAELLDQGDLLGAGGLCHHRDERQSNEPGEIGLGNGRAAAGSFHNGGAFRDPAVDQAVQEQRSCQAVLEAAGSMR